MAVDAPSRTRIETAEAARVVAAPMGSLLGMEAVILLRGGMTIHEVPDIIKRRDCKRMILAKLILYVVVLWMNDCL
jgi:hypothetical protein